MTDAARRRTYAATAGWAARSVAALLVAACASLAAWPALGCITLPKRDQATLYPALDAPVPIPQELTLEAGGLVSLWLRPGMKMAVYEGSTRTDDALVPLEEARYQRLTEEGGGAVPLEQRAMPPAAPGAARRWIRLGAARAGIFHLVVSEGRRSWQARIAVSPPAPVPAREPVRADERRQNEPLWISAAEALELELPGAVDDGWTTRLDGSGLQLMAIESAPRAGRVRLRFVRAPGADRSTVAEVTVLGHGERYNYTLRMRPVPLC